MEKINDAISVLVIDDDVIVRVMTEEILSATGMRVAAVANFQQALQCIGETLPDVVLLDVVMPEQNGFVCLQALQTAYPDLPVIMLTGIEDTNAIERAFEMGAADFIHKPIIWPVLRNRLQFVVRAARDRKQLAASEAELRTVQRRARLGGWYWLPQLQRLHCSEETLWLLDLPKSQPLVSLIDFCRYVCVDDAESLQQAFAKAAVIEGKLEFDLRIVDGQGLERILHILGETDSDTLVLQGTLQDISAYKRFEAEVHRLSFYDNLTGLPNRALFKDILEQAMGYCDRYRAQCGVLFIGVNQFKLINESLGPQLSDRLLRQFAERLQPLLTDNGSTHRQKPGIARLADAEFTLLIDHISNAGEVGMLAERIADLLVPPFPVDGHTVHLSAHIGIVVYPGDGVSVDDIIKNGESAMRTAREEEGRCYQFYSAARSRQALRRLSLENSLRQALEHDQFLLHFQPQVDSTTQRIYGVEALLRWRHPQKGLLLPEQFLAVAEETKLIVPIGRLVLVKALAAVSHWDNCGLPPLTMSINVAAGQLQSGDLLDDVLALLAEHDLPPDRVTLEITESQLMKDAEATLQWLQRLKQIGVRIAMDDFGTGYSSLSYLKRFPIDILKIDRSFVADIPENREDLAIIHTILALARSLGLEIVVEGVENQRQVEHLAAQGCNRFQGFYFAEPLAGEALPAYIRRNNGN